MNDLTHRVAAENLYPTCKYCNGVTFGTQKYCKSAWMQKKTLGPPSCLLRTLDFLISIGLRLLIFEIFSSVYGLIREPTLIEFGNSFLEKFLR